MAVKKYKIEGQDYIISNYCRSREDSKIKFKNHTAEAVQRCNKTGKFVTVGTRQEEKYKNNPVRNKTKSTEYDLFWSKEDDCFICQGKEYTDIIGIGETEEEAIKVYYELLKNYLKDKRENKLIKNKGGRPKKSNAKLVYNVPHQIKAFIEMEAARNEVNQGAIVEKIVKFYQEANKEELSKYYD